MRVLIVTGMYPTASYPGRGLSVKPQVEALRTAGIDARVLFFDGRSSKVNYLRGAVKTARKTRRERFDVIHGHYVYGGLVARCQVAYPVVVSFTGSDVFQSKTRWLSKIVARMAQAVIVKSALMKDSLNLDKAFVLPSGIDLGLFRPMPMETARERLDLKRGSRYVLFVGEKDNPSKRFDRAQAAFRSISSSENVEFLGLHQKGVPHDKMPLYLNACDVLLLTSDWEGSPNIVKEAMACNLPIVCTDVGDVRKVAGRTEGCYIVEKDPAVLGAKLDEALEFGRRTDGREKIQWLSSERISRRLIAIYRSLSNNNN